MGRNISTHLKILNERERTNFCKDFEGFLCTGATHDTQFSNFKIYPKGIIVTNSNKK
jgi:hypothetical protein